MMNNIRCIVGRGWRKALAIARFGFRGLLALNFALSVAKTAYCGESTASFLRIPVSARAVGLGAGYLGLANDVLAPLDNTAGLAHLSEKQMGFSYSTHIMESNLGYLGYGHPTSIGVFGLNYLTFRSQDIEGRDKEGSKVSNYGVEDRSIGVSFARTFKFGSKSEPVRVGSSLKYVQSTIASYSGTAYAIDLGAQYHWNSSWKPMDIGFSIKNFGSKLAYANKKESLPMSAALGIQLEAAPYLSLGAGLVNFISDNRSEITSGVEFAPIGRVMQFRGTYGVSRSANTVSPMLSGGIGMTIRSFRLDYAFAPIGELGSAQKINLTFKFGSPTTSNDSNAESVKYNYSNSGRGSK